MSKSVRDAGSALVLTVLAGLAVTGSALVAVVPVAGTLLDRQRAHAAADAAALAGVTGGQAASAGIAAANGGELVAWGRAGRSVIVTVQVGEQRVTARATDGP